MSSDQRRGQEEQDEGVAKAPPNGRNRIEGVKLREMTIDDVPDVFHLGEELFSSSDAPNLYRTWDEWEVVSLYQGEPDLCLVARHEDRLAGFALATTIEKRRSAWKYGQLAWLGVAPGYQRCGVGRRLFRAVKERMLGEGVRMVLVDTEADNEAGLRFFEREGFGHPEDHVYLSLNLSAQRQKQGKGRGG